MFPQIRLQSQQAQMQLHIQKPTQSIQQPKADLKIEQQPAEMTINRSPSKLTIDQSEARADMDLKSIARRIKEYSDKGYQDWLSGIARVAGDGDQLMMIENGTNSIPEISKRNSENPMYEFNIGFIPSHGSVKIDYGPGKLDIQWKRNKPDIQVQINKPILNYQPGKVSTSIKQYQSLQIDFENLKYVGINYERQI